MQVKFSKYIYSILLLTVANVGYAESLQCPDIANTLKEFSVSTSSSSYLNSVFDNYCEQNGTSKNVNGGVGLDTVIKAIPVKFTGSYSSNEEAVKNFCKTYSSSTSLQERKFSYEERIAGKALETINECLRLQGQGVTVSHNIVNKSQATFFLKASVDQNIKLSGVTINGNVLCDGQVGGISKNFNKDLALSISTTQNFVCNRPPIKLINSPAQVFEEAAITVSTNFGNYSVLWPRDERLPEDMASEISKNIDIINSDLASTIVNIKPLAEANSLAVYQCPSGTAGVGHNAAWMYVGCNGQISSERTCTNIWNGITPQNRECKEIGSIRLFKDK